VFGFKFFLGRGQTRKKIIEVFVNIGQVVVDGGRTVFFEGKPKFKLRNQGLGFIKFQVCFCGFIHVYKSK